MSKIIVMIGAPGAGKGTQARLLSEKYSYPQISTGDILREMAQADTSLGRGIRATQASGKLVSDEILAEVILTRTSQPDCKNGYILDGYPRTLNQARQLEELAERQHKDVFLVRVLVHVRRGQISSTQRPVENQRIPYAAKNVGRIAPQRAICP